jgi:hypothetical protein
MPSMSGVIHGNFLRNERPVGGILRRGGAFQLDMKPRPVWRRSIKHLDVVVYSSLLIPSVF